MFHNFSTHSLYIKTLFLQTSDPSETIIAWTDPIVPAYAEPPAVHPNEGLKEGDSMTVLCIAMGTPKPTVTLYLGQHPIRSEKSRHMVTTIYNITRDMQSISCYVDNGFGTPMQASRNVKIERGPRIKVYPESKSIVKHIDQSVRIECEVDAWPAPSIQIKRKKGSVSDSRFSMVTKTIGTGLFKTTLTIDKAQARDSDEYICSAENVHGSVQEPGIKVLISQPTNRTESLMQCCRTKGVKKQCQGICTMNLDLDFLLFDSECIPEFDKFMACGSDGSDHRHCCHTNGVPRECLDWCRGLPSTDQSETCALSHARTIVQCFHEGHMTLPGPPVNIRVTPTSATSAIARWDIPNKNPQVVDLYRILWRPMGSGKAYKVDTSQTYYTIENLLPGVEYELVIKAGNANGTSQLTPPLRLVI